MTEEQTDWVENIREKLWQTGWVEDIRENFARHRLNSPPKTLARKVNPVQIDISRILTTDTGKNAGENQLS